MMREKTKIIVSKQSSKVQFTQIGTTSDWFFWGFQGFEGKAYFGTYQMQGPRIYCHPPWEALLNFPGAESVLGLEPLGNKLYAASEDMGDAGRIYRRDGPSVWTPVHQETSWYPKPFKNFNAYLYSAWTRSSKEVKILRSSDGVSWDEVAFWQNKGIFNFVKHEGELCLLGCFEPSTESWAVKTSDGVNWSDVPALCHHSYPSGWASGVSVEGNLLLGQIGGKSIYKYVNDKKEKVFEIPESVYGTHSCCKWNGEIWFLFGQRWKAPSGNSYLYKSPTGELNSWELVASFDKPIAYCIGVSENELYLGIQNTAYKVVSGEKKVKLIVPETIELGREFPAKIIEV